MIAEPALPNPLPIRPFALPPAGMATLPGSKSITNRALILAALGDGEVAIEGALFSRDTTIMITALQRLGFRVEPDPHSRRIRVGGQAGCIPVQRATLDVGNAGTAARFLTAMLALAPDGDFALDGDEAMRQRPMEGLLRALADAGARFVFREKPWHFPFKMQTAGLRGGSLTVDAAASSQILSALLMVAPLATAPLRITLAGSTVSEPFVAMTRHMMKQFGRGDSTDAGSTPHAAGDSIPHGPYRLPQSAGDQYRVEPDATAASYFAMLPIVSGGSVQLPRIRSDDRSLQGDAGFVDLLCEHGLIAVESDSDTAMVVRAGPERCGITADFNAFSDTFLTLAAAAPLLEGPTSISGIGHTRHQETDRIAAMATELRRLEQVVREEPGALHVTPRPDALRAAAAAARERGEILTVDTYDDHRIAMSFAILGAHDLLGDGEPWLSIAEPGCCAKTFPGFFAVLDDLHPRDGVGSQMPEC